MLLAGVLTRYARDRPGQSVLIGHSIDRSTIAYQLSAATPEEIKELVALQRSLGTDAISVDKGDGTDPFTSESTRVEGAGGGLGGGGEKKGRNTGGGTGDGSAGGGGMDGRVFGEASGGALTFTWSSAHSMLHHAWDANQSHCRLPHPRRYQLLIEPTSFGPYVTILLTSLAPMSSLSGRPWGQPRAAHAHDRRQPQP